MSSCYSSGRTSFASKTQSLSAPETPVEYQQKTGYFQTAPSSPPLSHRSSYRHSLDAQILTHKLQLYQLEEEAGRLARELRKRMEDRQAADVAAAARFRDQLENAKLPERSISSVRTKQRSISAGSKNEMFDTALRRSGSMKMVRSRKPIPLLLSSQTQTTQPQEVQSAALPSVRPIKATDEMKKHWRRTTISAPRNDINKVLLISSEEQTECDYTVETPPVPQLYDDSPGSDLHSPQTASPITPNIYQEDRIRRELETFAIRDGPNLQPRRVGGLSTSAQRPLAVYIPDLNDIMTEKELPATPRQAVQVMDQYNYQPPPPSPAWRKAISRFDRRNDVDTLLDMYYTAPPQEEHSLKKKPSRSRRQTLFRKFQSIEYLGGKA